MATMTPMQRVLTTLQHQEPDRTPFFLLLSIYGAKELGISIKEYFSKPENIVEAQLRMQKKFHHDCLCTFFYAAIEMEAWGSTSTVFYEDGPPNSGEPLIRDIGEIKNLQLPQIKECANLQKVLKATRLLKERVGDTIPIIGVVISPFSEPVMQLGFDKYIELLYSRPNLFNHLMKLNKEFSIQWANEQLNAGATAICFFDPLASTDIIPRELFLKTGYMVAQESISKINGPTCIHLASGRSLNVLGDIIATGTNIVAVSAFDDLSEIKANSRNKITIAGNINTLEMRKQSKEEAENTVKEAILKGAHGGGFILSDNHGEIPWQVPEETLVSISKAVHKWGKYPISGKLHEQA